MLVPPSTQHFLKYSFLQDYLLIGTAGPCPLAEQSFIQTNSEFTTLFVCLLLLLLLLLFVCLKFPSDIN